MSMASLVRWLREHPFGADSLLAALLTAIAIPGIWVDVRIEGFEFRDPDGWAVVLVLAQTVPLAWRRKYPLLVLPVVGIATLIQTETGYPPTTGGLAVVIALYTVAAHCPRRESIESAVITGVAILVALLTAPYDIDAATFVSNYVVFATAWILGDNVRVRRAYVAELEARTRLLERERKDQAKRAVASERGRIARELHDVVAHNVSVMVVQAGAARRVLDSSPEQVRESLGAIEATGRQALNEMRRLLGVLRDDEDEASELTPQPGVAAIEGLIEQVREAGLSVELEVDGQPRPLSTGVDLSAYRIVQEALTNTLKHGGQATARVVLRYRPADFEVEVVDDGRGAGADRGNGRPVGHGLVGMRERVSLFGGELKTGPRPGGGYVVRARLPLPADDDVTDATDGPGSP
jgi:signal transduction histidine kinase